MQGFSTIEKIQSKDHTTQAKSALSLVQLYITQGEDGVHGYAVLERVLETFRDGVWFDNLFLSSQVHNVSAKGAELLTVFGCARSMQLLYLFSARN